MAELVIQRSVPAPPERIWRAFTTAELGEWFWPPAWDVTTEIDLRPGARYRIVSNAGGMAVGGEYLAIEPPKRLVQAWRWEGEGLETTVTLTFERERGGTLVTITHAGFADDQTRDDHIQGWNDCLARLEPYLTRT